MKRFIFVCFFETLFFFFYYFSVKARYKIQWKWIVLWFIFPQYYCPSALCFVTLIRMTHWYQKSLTHTRPTGNGECERFSLPPCPAIFNQALTAEADAECVIHRYNKLARDWTQKYAMWEQRGGQMRTNKIQMRTKEPRSIYNLRQLSNRGYKTRPRLIFWKRKHYNEAQCHLAFRVLSCYHVMSFMPCMDLQHRTWWAPESSSVWNTRNSSQFKPQHSDLKLLLLLLWFFKFWFCHSSSLSIIHIIVTLQIDWTRRWVSYLRYCLYPTGCTVALVFPCI